MPKHFNHRCIQYYESYASPILWGIWCSGDEKSGQRPTQQFYAQPLPPMREKAYAWRRTRTCYIQSWCRAVRFSSALSLLPEIPRGWRDGSRSWSRLWVCPPWNLVPKSLFSDIFEYPCVCDWVENTLWIPTPFTLNYRSLSCCRQHWLLEICLLWTLLDTFLLLNDLQAV